MPSLKRARPAIYALLALLLLLDVGLVIYLVSPLRPRPQELAQQLGAAQEQLKQTRAQVEPLLGMDQKLKTAQKDLDQFYRERFAASGSAIASELGKLAAANGVQLSEARYGQKPSSIPGVQQMKIDAGLEGPYVNDVKFINALERDRMFFILDHVALEQQQAGTVRLQLSMATFLGS